MLIARICFRGCLRVRAMAPQYKLAAWDILLVISVVARMGATPGLLLVMPPAALCFVPYTPRAMPAAVLLAAIGVVLALYAIARHDPTAGSACTFAVLAVGNVGARVNVREHRDAASNRAGGEYSL